MGERGQMDGECWGESLVAAASHLCRLNPTNRAEQSAAHIPAPASLSLPLPDCVPKKDAPS